MVGGLLLTHPVDPVNPVKYSSLGRVDGDFAFVPRGGPSSTACWGLSWSTR